MSGRIITGVERDRAIIRGAALKIIRQLVEHPKYKASDTRRDWLAPPPLHSFRRLEPLGFGLRQDDWWVFNPRDCPPDLVWPLDVGVAMEEAGEEGILQYARTYTISAKQVRGYASRFGPFMVRHDHAMVDRGKLVTAAGIWVWLGGRWMDAQKRTLWSGRDADVAIPERHHRTLEGDSFSIQASTALALRQRYEWAVSLGFEHSPSIRFATDPTGIKEIFKVRDLPDGKDRREALLTWVSDHWRQDRYDPDVELYVRKHLRGAISFTWRGLEAEILPSQFDLDQREKLIAERNAMREAGVDRRFALTGT